MLLWMIVCRISFCRQKNLSIYIFGSSHTEVFCKKVLNIVAKSLKCPCGVHFIVKLKAVVCIHSKTELLYIYFSGGIRLYLNFVICTYLSFASSFSLGKTWLSLFDFLPTRHSKLSVKNFGFSWLLFCLVSVILKSCTSKFSFSEK